MLDWVQEKIRRACAEGWTRLDLGNAGLTEIPDEVCTLTGLEVLVLGSLYHDPQPGRWFESENQGARNTIAVIPAQVARLTHLRSLSLAGNQISVLEPLAALRTLTSLHLGGNRISDLEPLAALRHLTSLQLGGNQIRSLEPLAALQNLTLLHLQINRISDLGPLAALRHLTSLELGSNQISDLRPLAMLQILTSLGLGGNRIRSLEPLATLRNLTRLELHYNQISALEPLAGLRNLTSLGLSVNRIGIPAPLATLWNLARLDLSRNRISAFPHFVLELASLETLYLYGNPIDDVPSEILGTAVYNNCLNAVRSHFADKAQGVALDREIKLILLGNGGVGKSSVVKRLVHDAFDPYERSTHGIRLEPWTLECHDGPMHLNIWDFGGQDIYHGTHALFLKSKALFLIVWDRETEQQPGYTADGLAFEHYPLQYWLDYVYHASPDAAVIVVENKCDDGRGSGASVPTTAPHVVFSAQAGHGREVLLAHIRDLCQRELVNRGAREIGIGRWRVKETLRQYLSEDETRPPAEKRYRTLSYDDFQQLCDAQQGQVASARDLLDYLHHTGVFFYQDGLFHDQIILDQRWVIDAIYTIFDRKRCYRLLQSKGGRFTQSDLHYLIWSERTEDEQKLLLSFMESCALCFCISDRDEQDPKYVAPDMLPAKDAVSRELSYRRRAGGGEGSSWYRYTHAFLHQGVMRRFIVEMGRQFRDTALYWKDGVFIDPSPDVQAMAVIECQRRVGGNPARGCITLEVWGSERARLLAWIRNEFARLTGRDDDIAQAVSLDGQHWVDVAKLLDARLLGKVVSLDGTVFEVQPFLFLLDGDRHAHMSEDHNAPHQEVSAMPPAKPAVYLSYAWGDSQEIGSSREALVDRLYDSLMVDGYTVKRDKMDLGYKGLISEFMRELGRGDCIVVIISDKYLKSPFCMFELLEIYRHHEFHDRICPIVLADARLRTLADRLEYVAHWKTELTRIEGLIQQIGFQVLSASGSLQEYEKYREITNHTDKLVTYLADINIQTPQLLEADDFATLKRAIDARLYQLQQH